MSLLRSFGAALFTAGLSLAANPCQGDPADAPGLCSLDTFQAVLPSGAFVVSVNKVAAGGCFGQDDAVDVAPPGQGSLVAGNYARNLNVASCAVVVGKDGYRFGLMLPDPAAWTQSFLAVGNNGFDGGITWVDMSNGVNQGLATMSTDTGHNSSTVLVGLAWAKNNQAALDDWGFNAMNSSVTMAKTLTKAYYRKASNDPNTDIKYSYYAGCSTGGRQGMVQMQRFPDSFDGVLVGAPAWDQVHLMPWLFKLGIDDSGPGAIDATRDQNLWVSMLLKEKAICDPRDGVTDGIISAPDQCKFANISDLLNCSKNNNTQPCYSQAQIDVLTQVFSDTEPDGTPVFPSGNVGSDFQFFTAWLNNNSGGGFGREWADKFLNFSPDQSYKGLNDLLAKAVATDPGKATANKTDLSDFKNRRGKLIMYHGTADAVVPTRSSEQYWNAMTAKMGNVDDWAMYLQIPGMWHCWQSDTDKPTDGKYFAPWMFGGSGQAAIAAQGFPTLSSSLFGRDKPQTDALAALRDWVEKGTRPSLTGTAPDNASKAGWRTRPLCPYPQRAQLKAGVSPTEPAINDANNWECR